MQQKNDIQELFEIILEYPMSSMDEAHCARIVERHAQIVPTPIAYTSAVTILYTYDPEAIDIIVKSLLYCGTFVITTEYPHKDEFFTFYNYVYTAAAHVANFKRFTQSVAKNIELSNNAYGKLLNEQAYIQNSIATMKSEENRIGSELEKAQNELKGASTQSITILGIFSAVVFSFSGGFSLIGSAFAGLKSITFSNAFLLIILTMLVSFALINIINLLLSFLRKINHLADHNEESERKKLADVNASFIAGIVICLALFIIFALHSTNTKDTQTSPQSAVIATSTITIIPSLAPSSINKTVDVQASPQIMIIATATMTTVPSLTPSPINNTPSASNGP